MGQISFENPAQISFSFCFLYSARSFFSSGQKAAAHNPPSRLLRSSAWALTHSQPNNQPPTSTSPTWTWPRLHQQHSPQLPRALSLSRRTVFLICIFGIRSHGSLLYFFRSFFFSLLYFIPEPEWKSLESPTQEIGSPTSENRDGGRLAGSSLAPSPSPTSLHS